MTVSSIIEGLIIINKNKPVGEADYHMRAEHDLIWAGSLEWPMPEEDKARLNELNWRADEEANGWRGWV